MNTVKNRHRRTPSVPLRVRRVSVSVSHRLEPATGKDDELDTVLSPSSADLPSTFPSSHRDTTSHSPSLNQQTPDSSHDRSDTHISPNLPGNSSEKYGFLVYAASLVAWYLFLFWGFTPDEWLEKLGLEWYPSRCARTLHAT